MATLFDYTKQVQRFLRDAKQEYTNPADIITYVNRARREVALRTQCIRALTPISGQVVSCQILSGGTGYTNPTVVISSSDFPAGYGPSPGGRQSTALATIGVVGDISAVDIQDGGSGYFQPQVSITDPTGSGFSGVLSVSPSNNLNVAQEVYNFSSFDFSGNPGVGACYFVRSVALIYSNYRYVLPMYAFSVYQAYVRQYPFQYQYVPTFASQFGQGTAGSLYLYPLPSQTYQFEVDCMCLPLDLSDNLSVEALPDPWTDAVPFYAAHLAYLELQDFNRAQGYLGMYEKFAQNFSNFTRIGRMVNPYGRY